MSKVIVRDLGSYEPGEAARIVDEVLEAAGPRLEGKKVLIKPNMLGFFSPERGVTTHPVIVKALVEAVRRRGPAEVIVGDNPGITGYSLSDKAGRVTGIMEAAGEAYRNISRGGEPVEVAGVKALVSREVLDADVLINVPRFKTHALTGITGAIKNMFGIFVGSEKVNLHRRLADARAFSSAMADVCAVRRPDLNVMDAVTGMEGNGPSWGRLRRVGKVLASADPVALDLVMARMMGIDPARVPMLERGVALGLGAMEGVELDGEAFPIPRFRVPLAARLASGPFAAVFMRLGFYFISRRSPFLKKKKCTGCAICAGQCPAEALTMAGKRPRIDRARCTRCFCCSEVCPEGAWRLKVKL